MKFNKTEKKLILEIAKKIDEANKYNETNTLYQLFKKRSTKS